jgi:hypothetical protein
MESDRYELSWKSPEMSIKPLPFIGWIMMGLLWIAPVTVNTAPGCQPIGRDAAAAAVQGATGGKVLGVQTRGKKNNPSYAVKVLLPDGRVRRVRVDACSGRVSD